MNPRNMPDLPDDALVAASRGFDALVIYSYDVESVPRGDYRCPECGGAGDFGVGSRPLLMLNICGFCQGGGSVSVIERGAIQVRKRTRDYDLVGQQTIIHYRPWVYWVSWSCKTFGPDGIEGAGETKVVCAMKPVAVAEGAA